MNVVRSVFLMQSDASSCRRGVKNHESAPKVSDNPLEPSRHSACRAEIREGGSRRPIVTFFLAKFARSDFRFSHPQTCQLEGHAQLALSAVEWASQILGR